MDIKVNGIFQIGKWKFGIYMYSTRVHLSTLGLEGGESQLKYVVPNFRSVHFRKFYENTLFLKQFNKLTWNSCNFTWKTREMDWASFGTTLFNLETTGRKYTKVQWRIKRDIMTKLLLISFSTLSSSGFITLRGIVWPCLLQIATPIGILNPPPHSVHNPNANCRECRVFIQTVGHCSRTQRGCVLIFLRR
jgi:hypothetical protein